jgi:hypothetical protein
VETRPQDGTQVRVCPILSLNKQNYSRGDFFQVLVFGRIRLSIGEEAEIDYTMSKRGEAFGWSGLVDREYYMSRAERVEASKVFKIDREKLLKLFEKRPDSGTLFFKRLAGAVLDRLACNYNAFLSEGNLKGVTSFGTRQVMGGSEE